MPWREGRDEKGSEERLAATHSCLLLFTLKKKGLRALHPSLLVTGRWCVMWWKKDEERSEESFSTTHSYLPLFTFKKKGLRALHPSLLVGMVVAGGTKKDPRTLQPLLSASVCILPFWW